jgi:type VI secretion system protein ImpG
LLQLVYPGYLKPIPSMTIVECLPDPAQGKMTAGERIPAGTQLATKATVDGMPCKFSTVYDVELWPISVAQAEWRGPGQMKTPPRASSGDPADAAARLLLRCYQDVTFPMLPISKLRFYLSGDGSVVFPLYELLADKCFEIQLRNPGDPSQVIVLDKDCLKPVGFAPEEALLPVLRHAVDGHRLLQEYFALPEKFLFFELSGLEALSRSGFEGAAEVIFLFRAIERSERKQILELGVKQDTFRIGCTPAINLFPLSAEPIQLNQRQSEYIIIPNQRHKAWLEPFEIQEVVATNPRLRRSMVIEPMYRHRYQTRPGGERVFWVANRRRNESVDKGPTLMTISLVDLAGALTEPNADVLVVRMLATNFDLPSNPKFQWGMPGGDFEAAGCAAAKTVMALRRPTPTQEAPLDQQYLWRLISSLSLNYLSISEGGKTALQEILRLHNIANSDASERQIAALQDLEAAPGFALVNSPYGLVPARGTRVETSFDEEQFAGAGLYLFLSVIDRFLAGYASVNSFVQLSARSTLRKEPLGRWPERSGSQMLL